MLGIITKLIPSSAKDTAFYKMIKTHAAPHDAIYSEEYYEVAEHLPAACADRYVSLLCQLAPIVVCSAAKPGQDGTDHVNLQPQSYWIEKFERGGHHHQPDKAKSLSARWSRNGVATFYFDNLMVFCA
jgi:hypothetical protein